LVSAPRFISRHKIDIDSANFEYIIDGMEQVVKGGGTASNAALADIVICGKTGTAQNPHGENHSVFIAFAPKFNPKIAIAVYVENAGYGATYAAPIASLMIEKYIKGQISNKWQEEYILNLKLPKK
jgi:penicillin-binding protein 2